MADYKVSGDTRQDTARAASAKPSGCCCSDKSFIFPFTFPPHSFYGGAQLRHIVLTTTQAYLGQTPSTREIRLHWLAKTGDSFTELSNSKKEKLKLKIYFGDDNMDLTFSACTTFLKAHRKAAGDKRFLHPKATMEHNAIIKRTGDMCAMPKKAKGQKKGKPMDGNVDKKCMCFALESVTTRKLRVMRVIDSTSESAKFSAAVRAALRPHPDVTFRAYFAAWESCWKDNGGFMDYSGSGPKKHPALKPKLAQRYAEQLGKCEVLATKVYEAACIPAEINAKDAKENGISLDDIKAKIVAATTSIRDARQGVLCAFNIFSKGAADDKTGCMGKEFTISQAPSNAHQDATMLKSILKADRLTEIAFIAVNQVYRVLARY